MKKTLSFFLFAIIIFLGINACSPSKTIGTKGEEDYNENIEDIRLNYTDSIKKAMIEPRQESTRPTPEGPKINASLATRYSINTELDDFLVQVSDNNARNNVYQGFTVQVYTGNSREKANEAKNMVYSLIPESNPAISFDPPNYKVKVGEFTDRLEAQPIYSELKGNFPVVLIVPERFKINKDD